MAQIPSPTMTICGATRRFVGKIETGSGKWLGRYCRGWLRLALIAATAVRHQTQSRKAKMTRMALEGPARGQRDPRQQFLQLQIIRYFQAERRGRRPANCATAPSVWQHREN
jgi:hypothetical protein